MKELGTRALTGALYVALTLGAAYLGPEATALLFLPVCVLAMREIHQLYWDQEDDFPMSRSMVSGGLVHVALSMHLLLPAWTSMHALASCLLVTLVILCLVLVRGRPGIDRALGGILTQLVLVAMPFGLLSYFFAVDPWIFAAFMVLLWTNDTGAYLVGKAIGRHKLLPAVSPKKSVEGLLGGTLLTVAVAWAMAPSLELLSPLQWIGLALIVASTATLGDLIESALKRKRGVKDSGKILPGHGGVLDRFDGFLLAVPSALLYLHICL